MKKIITLLFCFGLFTAAFAQSDRHADYRDQKNITTQPSQSFRNNDYNKSNQYQQQTTYNNSQWGKGDDRQKGNDRDDRNQYGYDKRTNDRFRDNDRDDRFRDNSYNRQVVVRRPSLLGVVLSLVIH